MDERQRDDAAPENPGLTVREAAVLLGLPEARIRRMLHKGLLVGRREGRRWRIDAETVAAYQQTQAADANDRKPPSGKTIEAPGLPRESAGDSEAGTEQPSVHHQAPAQPTTPAPTQLASLRYRASRRALRLLYAHSRLPQPARWLLSSIGRDAEQADVQETFRRRDVEKNIRYALPDGEQPVLAAVWTVELYTPSSIAGLLDALQRHNWLRPRSSGSTDAVRWVQDHRGRPGSGGWMWLPRVIPPGTGGPFLDANVGEVPDGFSSIHLAIVAVTSTLTAVVGCFLPTDELAAGLEAALRREHQTTVSPNPSGGWSIHSVEQHKHDAVDAMRTGARQAAMDWMQRYLPGVFARGLLEGDMPTFDLILTESAEPLVDNSGPRQPNRAWLDLLALDTAFFAWICRDVAGLKMTLPRSIHEHHVTLAAQRSQLFHDDQLDDPRVRRRQELSWKLDADYLAPSFAAQWAINGLLSGVERRLARIRDLAERSSHRRSIRMLDELRQELLSVGLDGHVVAADVIAFTNAAALYDHNMLEFVKAWTPKPTEATTPAPPATIPAALREHQQQRAQQILDSERQLRDLLGATSNLAGTVTNLRLQRRVAILTAVSTVAAIIALLVAVLSLNLSQSNSPPATSSPGPTATSLATPTSTSSTSPARSSKIEGESGQLSRGRG
jgi:excisionase family DNA binding protein